MTMKRTSRKTNFRVVPQDRPEGVGAGRRCFPWKRKYPWLLIAVEQLAVEAAGSEGALLEDRNWASEYGVGPRWVRSHLDQLFPGLNQHLDGAWDGDTPWEKNLLNRVYKMYYNGSSARGYTHDPKTRASISKEHWRTWSCRDRWEATIVRVVHHKLRVVGWRGWL